MSIIEPYLIFLVLVFLTFIVALKLKKNKIEGVKYSARPVYITIGIVAFYYVSKFFLGWRLTNWYAEAFLFLGVLVVLDYYILVKERYVRKLTLFYFIARTFSFLGPVLLIFATYSLALLTFGWGAGMMIFAFPIDTSQGEQWLCKNLYIYENDREGLGGGLVFKKKILFLEKDVVRVKGSYWLNYGINQPSNVPSTGYVRRESQDTIYILPHQASRVYRSDHYFCITVLADNKVKIEQIGPGMDGSPNRTRVIETHEIQL
ncbi:hypothetical protein ACKUSY_01630 [Myroides odoratus]